jgi:hypothetical protein
VGSGGRAAFALDGGRAAAGYRALPARDAFTVELRQREQRKACGAWAWRAFA